MDIKRIETNEEDLKKLGKKCRAFFIVFHVLFLLSIIVLIGLCVFTIASQSFFPDNYTNSAQTWISLISSILLGVIVCLLFRTIALVLKDISKNESPFTKKQVKRLRIIVLLLIIYAVLEFLISTVSSVLVDVNSSFHYSLNVDESTTEVNLMAIVFAAIMYSVSVVFEYGSKLQERSDEIL